MNDLQTRLRQAIAALDDQRGAWGDDVVDWAQAALNQRLAGAAQAGPVQTGPPTSNRPAAQHLRQVSVLFIDVVGSTALSQHLAPEDIHAVMDGTLASFTRIVRAHGGAVLQYAGDSMLAAFGTPSVGEDDAVRAVRAALAILARAREQTERVRQRHGHDGFGVRAGIATGPVLLGGGVDGDHSIRGMTVNLAARMEQTAPAGALRICPDTRRLVRGLFDLQEQPSLQVKGRDEPVRTWLVAGVAPAEAAQAERGVGGVACAMVGRDAELAALQELHRRWQAEAPAAVVVIVLGEAGLGKSRLVAEYRAWTAAQPGGARWLQAHGGERDQGRPYGLLRQLFTRPLRILDSDTPADARSKWLETMTPLLRSQGDAAVLGHLLGLDFAGHDEVRPMLGEGRQLRDRAFFHAAQALRSMAKDGPPLLALLDDLHWADPGTLDFVDHVQKADADLPLLLLATARPVLLEHRPGWERARDRHGITLAPLDPGAALALADALLARLAEVPDSLRERLTAGAEGNPFFMEELVNMLVDRGVIEVHLQGWRLRPERMNQARLPSTLAGVLQARLDSLDADESQLLQLAAVVGPVFWDEALRALGLGADLPLARLTRRQMIAERQISSLEGRREFAFRHQLMHQVCYERVLQRVKVPAHARVAQWLQALPGDKPLDLIAEHLERGEEPLRARDAWHQAAEVAQGRYANDQALAHAERAVRLTGEAELDRRYDLSLLRCEVLALLMRQEPLQLELQALDQLAERSGDAAKRSRAADRRARCLFDSGDAAAARVAAEAALALAPAHAPRLAARAGQALATILVRLGCKEQAAEHAQRALGLSRLARDLGTEGAILNALGIQADDQGDFSAAMGHYRQALLCTRASKNRSHEAGVLSNLGYIELGLGDYERAKETFESASRLFERIGQHEKRAIVGINQALVALNSGRPDAALAHAEQALPLLQTAGSRWASAAALRVAGQALMALRQWDVASARLSEAKSLFEALQMPQLAMEVLASQAQLALAQGHATEALALADQVLHCWREGVGVEGAEEPLRIYLACWQALAACADPRADELLNQAQQLLQQRASQLSDLSSRESFLRRVPHHRAVLEAWAAVPDRQPAR